MRTILVTGAAGFVGHAVAHRLLDRGERVIEGVFFTRDLVTEPPNVLNPAEMAERVAAAFPQRATPEGVRAGTAWRDAELAALDTHLRSRARKD